MLPGHRVLTVFPCRYHNGHAGQAMDEKRHTGILSGINMHIYMHIYIAMHL